MSAEFADQTNKTLNQRIARGAAWMVGLRLADRVVGFISTIVLARLLIPADFGLVALAVAMVAAVGVFGEFGFELALIQNQKADRRHYDTAWTLGLVRGAVTAIVIALMADLLAGFFGDPRLRNVILALALIPLLEGFYNIGTVAFRKELTLNKEFVFRIVPRVAGVVVTIAFALAWRDYWALICGTLAGTALRLFMSYMMSGYRPRVSLAGWRDIIGFSKWTLVTSIAAFASQKADTVIIAKFLDAHSLGIFSIATQIADMASAELIAPIKQALFPGYAKIAHDVALLRKAFLDVYALLVLIALPAAIGIGLTADLFVPILLGSNWADAVPLIEILVISGGLRALSSHVRPVYLAMNRPHLGAYAQIGRAFVFLPMLIFGLLYFGIEGAAVAHAIGRFAVFVGSLYLMRKLLGLTLGDIWATCWRPLLGCGVMVLMVETVKWWFAPNTHEALAISLVLPLALAVAAGFIGFVGSVLLLWRLCGRPVASAESHLLFHLSRILRRAHSSVANVSQE
jgi:O-antigen/teichoic acid export membrane protein